MDDLKVYTPEVIQDEPFPGEESGTTTSRGSSSQVFTPEKTADRPFPAKDFAKEVISPSLNTKSKKILGAFEFTSSGSIKIGELEEGIHGDISLSPIGIVARNSSGETTFALDGETGDATFSGTLTSSSVLTGIISVGDGNIIIDGVNNRIIFNDGTNDRMLIGYQAGGF